MNLTILLCALGMLCPLALGQDSFYLECGKNMVYNKATMSCVSMKRPKQASCPHGFKYNRYSQCERIAYKAGK